VYNFASRATKTVNSRRDRLKPILCRRVIMTRKKSLMDVQAWCMCIALIGGESESLCFMW
jgi:hypothetical protein